ncbi:efflux RND transporter periplasmic adaptor subunit [Pseudomonas indica]|uniref:RND family efflux transporter, MFP subunit n=1 Tax=Pseudomonas indica TaxID=137658 RepID=A0A1G9E1J3_9PSED|nr:efflux RND transporter periplasmic adaptor subunit [Pseudomonas indica]SDK69991.1 RND family efflux transporter, MFP subunit [Pseudomonas indica]
MKRLTLCLLAALGSGAVQALAVDVAPARAGIERQEIRAQLLPRQFTTLAAEIGAKVNKLPIPEGGAFKAGQALVSFDCSVQQAMLQKARAELNAAEATDKANRRLAELNSVGQLEVDLGRAGRQKAVAEVGAQQAVLAKCSITAPFAGRVAEQKVREQQYVQPGQPLLDILDDSVLELEFLVPSAWLVWLRPGQAFDVEIDETGQRYPARFERIGARVDPVSQSVKVAAAIDGRFPELMAGMSGRVRVSPPSP